MQKSLPSPATSRLCSFFASLFELSPDLCLSPAKDAGHGSQGRHGEKEADANGESETGTESAEKAKAEKLI